MRGSVFLFGLAVVGCAFGSSLNLPIAQVQKGIDQEVVSARSYSRSEQEEQKEEQKTSINTNVARSAEAVSASSVGGATLVGTGYNNGYKESSETKKSSSKSTYEVESQKETSKLSVYLGSQAIAGGANVIRSDTGNSGYIGAAIEGQSQALNTASSKSETKESSLATSQQSSVTAAQQSSLTSTARLAAGKQISTNGYAEGADEGSKKSYKQESQNAYNAQKDFQASRDSERSSVSTNNNIKQQMKLQQEKKQQRSAANQKGKKSSVTKKEEIREKQATEATAKKGSISKKITEVKAKHAEKAKLTAETKLKQKAYITKQKHEARNANKEHKLKKTKCKTKKESDLKKIQGIVVKAQEKSSHKAKVGTNNKPKKPTATLYGKAQAKNCDKVKACAKSRTQKQDTSTDYTKAKHQSSTNQKSGTKQDVQFDKNYYSNKKTSSNPIGLGKAAASIKQKNQQSNNKKVKADQTIRILTNYGTQSVDAAKAQNTYTKNNYRSNQGSTIAKSDTKSKSVVVQNGAKTDAVSVATSRDRGIDANQNAAISTASNGMTEIVLNQQMAAQSRKSRTETSASSVANSESGSNSIAAAAGSRRADGKNQINSYGTVAKSSQYKSSSQAESKKSETYEESSRIKDYSSQVKAKVLYGI